MLPGEEREDRARPTGLVAVIEVIGPRVVEVNRPLDQPQAQGAAVEVQISQWVAGDCCDVVKA